MPKLKLVELVLAPVLALAFSSPALSTVISTSNTTPAQGQTIEVLITPDASSGTVDGVEPPVVLFNGSRYKSFPVGEGSQDYRTLLGIPADLKPGSYKISVGDESLPIKVLAGKFGRQYLTLSKKKDNFLMSPGEEETVDKAKSTVSDNRMWTGNFVHPSKARISSGFGLRRVVNGKLLADYFHSGLDFAGGLGSPVVATADGKVIIAHNGWRLHGNTVCIDHGQGVVSFYIHLNKIFVKEGQTVKAGEKIAAIGSTGRANGPHLHFSIYVNKAATNPHAWFKKAF